MAYRFVRGNSQHLELAQAIVSADAPCTFFVWGKSDSLTVDQDALSVSDEGTNTAYRINFGGTTAGDPIRARKSAGGTNTSSNSGTAYSLNRWNACVARFISNTSRYSVKDGTVSPHDTTSASHGNALDRTNFGTYYSTTKTNYFSGLLAEGGIVRGLISNQEALAFCSGIPLDEIFSQNRLLLYMPLSQETLLKDFSPYDWKFSALGGTGTPVPVSDHPPIIRTPKRRFYLVSAPGGAVSGSVAESVSSADTPSASLDATASIAEAVSAADTLSAVHVAGVSVAESASAADLASALADFASALAEVAAGSDSPSALADFAASVAEAASAADEASGGQSGVCAENAAAVDSASAVLVAIAACAESIAAADSPSAAVAFLAAMTETVAAGDLVAASAVFEAAQSEAVAGSDSASALAALLAAAAEAASASDAAAAAFLSGVFLRDPEFSFRAPGRFSFRPDAGFTGLARANFAGAARGDFAFRPRAKFEFKDRP